MGQLPRHDLRRHEGRRYGLTKALAIDEAEHGVAREFHLS